MPLYINPRARRYLGVAPDAKIDSLMGVWENPEQRAALVAELAGRGATGALEADLIMAGGRRMKALVSATRIAYGGRQAMLAATVDITDLRRTEAALRESQARLRAFMDFAPVAAHLRDAEGRYLMYNRRMEELIGVPAAEALGKRPSEIRLPEIVGDSDRHHELVIETGRMHVSEQYLTYTQGDPRWAMTIRFPALDADGRVDAVGTFAVDITEQKETEAALKASEARLNAIIAADPVAMNIARLADRKLLFVNEPYVRLYGLEGLDLDSFDRNTLYPDPAQRDWIYGELSAGREITDYELMLLRADGGEVPVSLTSRPILFQGEPAIVTTSVDLTALRGAQAEVARSREALHQGEKLTALGALLAGVAHELNNPLSVVVGYSSMLRELPCDPANAPRIEKIHAAAERCARIVRTFLAMARARPPQPRAGHARRGGHGLAGARRLRPQERRRRHRRRPARGAAAGARRHRPAAPGGRQPHRERPARADRPPLAAAPRGARLDRGRRGGARGRRQRPGHGAGGREARLRAVLHHQAAGRRHRGRALGLPRHRRGARRADRARHRPRPGRPLPRAPAAVAGAAAERPAPAPAVGTGGRVLVVDDGRRSPPCCRSGWAPTGSRSPPPPAGGGRWRRWRRAASTR